MNPTISVIVPVYKVEAYLARCIESVLTQTYTDLELILIDDGSPDNCGAICDAYATKDDRIVVIHQTNSGVSAARNAGLEVARGEYVTFCDSDDSLPESALTNLIHSYQSSKVDMVVGDFEYIMVDCSGAMQRKKSEGRVDWQTSLYDEEALYAFWTQNNMLSSCGKLFCAEKIREYSLTFDPSVIVMEDYGFVIDYLSHCATIGMITDVVYECYSYEDRPLLAKRSRTDFFDDVILASNKLKAFLEKNQYQKPDSFFEATIFPTLRFAYELLWSTSATGIHCRMKKYKRIREALSEDSCQRMLRYYKKDFRKTEYTFMKYKSVVGLLFLRIFRRFAE